MMPEILNRHLPAAEFHQAGAQFLVCGKKRRSFQRSHVSQSSNDSASKHNGSREQFASIIPFLSLQLPFAELPIDAGRVLQRIYHFVGPHA